jgi:hypothetical protein
MVLCVFKAMRFDYVNSIFYIQLASANCYGPSKLRFPFLYPDNFRPLPANHQNNIKLKNVGFTYHTTRASHDVKESETKSNIASYPPTLRLTKPSMLGAKPVVLRT